MKNKCPVCLNNTLDEPYQPYSYDICMVCGVEFGFDDAINEYGFTKEDWEKRAPKLIEKNHDKLRKIWIEAGCPVWEEEVKKPDFKGGVSWIDNYWKKHPEEEKEWQENLGSLFLYAQEKKDV